MSTDSGDLLGPVDFGPDTGELRWWGDSVLTFKASLDTTAGRLTVIDNYAREGAAAPLHIHHNEGEGFYVVEGTMTIWVGGTTTEASAGSFVYGPPGVPHTFVVTSPVARYLFICEPAGFEGFVRATSTPAERMALPPKGGAHVPGEVPAPEELAALWARYGLEELGPPGIPTDSDRQR